MIQPAIRMCLKYLPLFGLTLLVVFLRRGFSVGVGTDQWIYMAKGLSLADPTILMHDWHLHNSPEPHLMFDFANWLGERLHLLVPMHVFYFVATVMTFHTAVVLWAQKLNLAFSWIPILVTSLVIWGPVAALGQTTPLLGIALPHSLGACMLFLLSAALIHQKAWLVVLSLTACAAAHIHHGFLATLLSFAFLTLGEFESAFRRRRVSLLAFCTLVLLAICVTVHFITPDLARDAVLLCDTYFGHHCNARSWNGWHTLLQAGLFLFPTLWILHEKYSFNFILWDSLRSFPFTDRCNPYLDLPNGIRPFRKEPMTLYTCG